MGTPLDPKHNHRITLDEAAALTRRFRHGGAKRLGDSVAFNAEPVKELLAQEGCVGIRCYQGLTAEGTPTVMLVGVDAKGNDMTSGVLLDWGMPCPPYCPDDDALNR